MSEVPLYLSQIFGRDWSRYCKRSCHVYRHRLNGPIPEGTRGCYKGTWLIRNRHPVAPYSRTMPRLLCRSWGGVRFLMSQVPLKVVCTPTEAGPGERSFALYAYSSASTIRKRPPPYDLPTTLGIGLR